MDAREQATREQAAIGDQIRAGDDNFPLWLGAQDWLKEEAMLRRKQKGESNAQRDS